MQPSVFEKLFMLNDKIDASAQKRTCKGGKPEANLPKMTLSQKASSLASHVRSFLQKTLREEEQKNMS